MKSKARIKGMTKSWSTLLLVVTLSLIVGGQSFAAETQTSKTLTLGITASDYHSIVYQADGKVWYWGGVADSDKPCLRANRHIILQSKRMEQFGDGAEVALAQSACRISMKLVSPL